MSMTSFMHILLRQSRTVWAFTLYNDLLIRTIEVSDAFIKNKTFSNWNCSAF